MHADSRVGDAFALNMSGSAVRLPTGARIVDLSRLQVHFMLRPACSLLVARLLPRHGLSSASSAHVPLGRYHGSATRRLSAERDESYPRRIPTARRQVPTEIFGEAPIFATPPHTRYSHMQAWCRARAPGSGPRFKSWDTCLHETSCRSTDLPHLRNEMDFREPMPASSHVSVATLRFSIVVESTAGWDLVCLTGCLRSASASTGSSERSGEAAWGRSGWPTIPCSTVRSR